MFEELKVFGNNEINRFCDDLYLKAGKNNLIICGGVSRCLHGEKHTPKDLDLVTKNENVFHDIKSEIRDWFPGIKITTSEKRIIIYTEVIAIEIWNGKQIHARSWNHYKNTIQYILSTRLKKVRNVNTI